MTKLATWITDTGVEGGESRTNPLAEYTNLKVYNPMMGSIPDIDKDGWIVELSDDGWIPFKKSLENVKVMALTKNYKGYATKLEDGVVVKDDEGKAITETYYTPEVDVYNKDNIAIAKYTSDGPKVLGKGGFKSYIDFTTSMQLEDGTLNPLFNTIGTNSQTGEKYPISIMKQEYHMYFLMDGAKFKIKLGSSYGRWKDIQEGTFLHAKETGMKAFKAIYPTMRFEHFYMTLNASVEKADKYKFIKWEFKSITEESMTEVIESTNTDVSSYNTGNFPGVELSNGIESLPFNMNRLILETSKKVATLIEPDISVEDVPF